MTPPLEALRKLLELAKEHQWSANLGQNSYGCPECCNEVEVYKFRAEPPQHAPDCALSKAIAEAEAALSEANPRP